MRLGAGSLGDVLNAMARGARGLFGRSAVVAGLGGARAAPAPRSLRLACFVLIAAMAVSATPASPQTTTSYQYDTAGRLVGVTYPGGRQITYRYDAAGNRIEIMDVVPNGPPSAVGDAITTQSSAPITFDPRVNDSDPEGGVLTISAVANAANGSAVINSGTSVTFTPTASFVGAASYQYTIADPQGATATATVAVTVTNRPPTAVADATTTPSNTAKAIDPRVNDIDPEGAALSVTALSSPVNGAAVITGGGTGVTFTPATNFVGTGSFAYTISDANGGTASSTVSVTVTNRPPVAVADSYAVGVSAITVNPRTNDTDPEGQTLTITAVTTPTQGTASIVSGGGSITYTPPGTLVGTATFSYTITDTYGATASAVVTVGNLAPTANADAIATLSSSAITFDPRGNDSDPEGGALTITGVSGATNGTAAVNGGTSVTFTPTANFVGAGSYVYTIRDPLNATASAIVSVTVQNRAPVANADAYSTPGNTAVTSNPRTNDSDPEGQALTIVGVSGATNGTAVVNGGTSVTFTPTSGFSGTASYQYTIQDAFGAQASATATITVIAPLTGSVSSTSWSWDTVQGSGTTTITPATVTASGSGGAGGYTCLWEKVSGDATTTASAPNACTTAWSRSTVPIGTYTSTWRAKVTDSAGAFVYTQNVSVSFTKTGGGKQ